MGSIKLILVISIGLLTSSCQMGYLFKSAYHQLNLLNSRVPLEQALKDEHLNEVEKRKLILAKQAHEFAEQDLHLKPTQNYTSFVKLNRPYVTYVVSAAPKWKLEHHQWWYPIVGKMPYKGYFDEEDAKVEQQNLKSEDLDTYLRGVAAYSTLGWFKDPILSSMLQYKDFDLVNTVIHETVHATIYIKNSADFNERLAVFLGNKGMERFYLKNEGPESATLRQIQLENEDDKTFSAFIGPQIKQLKEWYEHLSENERNESVRMEKIKQIQNEFTKNIWPQMKTQNYKKFSEIELNNARLLIYKTYMQDLSDFEKLYIKVGSDFQKFIDECRKLETSKNPEEDLKKIN